MASGVLAAIPNTFLSQSLPRPLLVLFICAAYFYKRPTSLGKQTWGVELASAIYLAAAFAIMIFVVFVTDTTAVRNWMLVISVVIFGTLHIWTGLAIARGRKSPGADPVNVT